MTLDNELFKELENIDGYVIPRSASEVGMWFEEAIAGDDPNLVLQEIREKLPELFDPAFIARGIMYDDEEELWCDLAHAIYKMLLVLGRDAPQEVLEKVFFEIILVFSSLTKLARIRSQGVPDNED